MLAIFFYWLSLCLLILAPAIAMSLMRDYKIQAVGMFTYFLVAPFILFHLIVSAVPFILTTLLMLTSVT